MYDTSLGEHNGANTLSTIVKKVRKHSQCRYSNGILLPIMRGKCLERHHICDAIMNAISFNQIKFELTRLIQRL